MLPAGLHGHLQGRDRAQRAVGVGERAVEGVGVTFAGRACLVTGAYGLLGPWLVRALLGEGASVTVVRHDRRGRSALVLDGLEERCAVVDGDDGAALLEAVEYERRAAAPVVADHGHACALPQQRANEPRAEQPVGAGDEARTSGERHSHALHGAFPDAHSSLSSIASL